jgi:O-antigen/teichoic acid export membrane protein
MVNVALRIGGIGSKFIVFTLMSKYFKIDVFGNYSLLTSIITIFIFVLGLDYYNFSIRDILTTSSLKEIRSKVITTFFFYGLIYLVFTVLAYFIFVRIEYIKPYVFLIIGLCITEHLSQEIYRLLISFKKVLFANILLFVRTMGWTLIIVYFLVFNIEITLEILFKLWLTANTVTILYVFGDSLFSNFKQLEEINIDYLWVKKGLKVCYLFLLATISLKSVEYANRFIVDFYLGKELAGVFTFYSSITMLITVYINTIVISYELPPLISFAKTEKITPLLLKFKKSILIQLLIASILLLIIIKPLLYWQGKEEFAEHLPLIFFMIIGAGLMNYSLIYHFKLYIFKMDFAIFKIMIFSGIISFILCIMLTSVFGLYGSGVSFAISGLVMFYLRLREANKVVL